MQKIKKGLSPNQFLFQEAILQVLRQGKKQIRIAPFQNIEPQQLVQNNNGNLYLDIYHQYFLAAMSNIKTKQLACTRYEKLIRENLFDRQHLAPQMISSILNACSSSGNSTTGSSHGSTNISPSSMQQQNQSYLYVVNLIKTILIQTDQVSVQIQLALNYILQGTRNKRYSVFYISTLQQIYNSYLVKNRQQPLKKIVKLQINHMLNQIEYHYQDQQFSFKLYTNIQIQNDPKKSLCIHDQKYIKGIGKFGKCFLCSRQADNYCKNQFIPVCSYQCKQKIRNILQNQNNKDYFDLLSWLLQNLPSGDQIIYSFLGRQIIHHQLSLNSIQYILKTIIGILTSCCQEKLTLHTQSLMLPATQQQHYYNTIHNFKHIQKHALNIFLHILFTYKHVYEKQLQKYIKVYFFEIVRILELIPIKRIKIKNQRINSKGQISSKQSLQSNLNLSIDNINHFQSLSSFNLNNSNVSMYNAFQQQFSNPFLNSLIQILANQDLFFYIYSKFDCKFFEQSLLAKMMNIISQYAKQQILSKQYGANVTASSAYGVYSILKMLMQRLVGYEKHKNLSKLNLNQENSKIQAFLQKYPIDQKQIQMKRQLQKIIQLFNKKPQKGIIALKKLFSKNQKIILNLSNNQINENKQSQNSLSKQKISEAELQKNVEKVKKKALILEKQALQSSRLSARQQSMNISIEQIKQQQPKIYENVEQIYLPTTQRSQNKQEISPMKRQKFQQLSQINESPRKKDSTKSMKQEQYETFLTLKKIAIVLRQNVDYESKIKKIVLFNKQKIAQYFGSTKNKQANEICLQFFKLDQGLYDKIQIDDCLRIEFNYFGLPKQGQQIQIVIDELSKAMLPFSKFNSSLHIFQYIYTLLMVQSGHNPNVKQNDKVKLQMFLSMVNHIQQMEGKAERDFHKIKKNSLNNLFNYGQYIFDYKYLMKIQEQEYIFKQINQIQSNQMNQIQSNKKKQIILNTKNNIINLKWLMQYIWQYVYISIVNNQKKNSTLGVFEAIVLYGKYNLIGQQFGFMQLFKRSYEYNKSKDSLQSLLRLGIEFNNYLFQWSYLISLSYNLEQSNTYHEHIDKIFTNLQFIYKSKLKIFLQSLCQFSTSEYKSDKGYNRQLFVLRHITEILQYNLFRLYQVWDQIWPQIQKYFKSICLHPRKQISMAAIDSYKQLSLKIFKIKSKNQIKIPHNLVIQTYLYIFQRSNIYMKDLIINILINVVSIDINSGWQIIYQILNINDSQDKTVVMKVVQRLVRQVGYEKLTSLQKLHVILIKQLRVNVSTVTLIQSILNRLWQVSQILNKRQIWLQTMRSIKDIYKMSLNNKLLMLFFKICNQCIQDQIDQFQQRKRRQSFDSMKVSVKKNQQIQQLNDKMQQINQQISISISVDRQIYKQIVDWLIFLMDIKHQTYNQNSQPYIVILKQALQHFKLLKTNYIIRYLSGVNGLLNIFTMFIYSQYKIVFLLFLRDFLKQKLLRSSNENNAFILIRKQPKKYVDLLKWLSQQFKDSKPSDLLLMKKLDQDFKKQRKNIFTYDEDNGSTQIVVVNKDTHKIQLIQFSLSAQQFNSKSISNLIFLDCIELVINHKAILLYQQFIDQSNKQIMNQKFHKSLQQLYQNIIENYSISRQTNNLIILRNFLWNNGFLLYNTYKDTSSNPEIQNNNFKNNNPINIIDINNKVCNKPLPGLHKHQKRSFQVIFKYLPSNKKYSLILQIIQDFIICYRLKSLLYFKKLKNGRNKLKNGLVIPKKRKISELIIKQNQITQNFNQRNQQIQQNRIRNDSIKNRVRNDSTSSVKNKSIKITQYENKNDQINQNQKIKTPIINLNNNKNSDEQIFIASMKQFYTNDIQNWIKLMEYNLLIALKQLNQICQDSINFILMKMQQKQNFNSQKYIIDEKQIVNIYLLCLDLCGQENCSLSIMRQSSNIMQKVLKIFMDIQIQYNSKDQQ